MIFRMHFICSLLRICEKKYGTDIAAEDPGLRAENSLYKSISISAAESRFVFKIVFHRAEEWIQSRIHASKLTAKKMRNIASDSMRVQVVNKYSCPGQVKNAGYPIFF